MQPGFSPQPPRPVRPSNAYVARIILAVMAGMAGLALLYALSTTQFRRDNDRRKAPPGSQDVLPAKGPTATSPAELAGLRFLPADTGLVTGLHLAELLQDEDGRKLWQQFRQGPAGALVQMVEERTGLKSEDIDHLVAGVSSPGGRLRAVVVAQTRRPYSPAALAKALAPGKAVQSQGRLVYRFTVGVIAEGLVFQSAPNTLIVSLGLLGTRIEDLETIPKLPRQGLEGLLPVVRDCLTNRVPRSSLVWAAASIKDLPWLVDLGNLGMIPERARVLITQLQAFGAGIRFQGGVTLECALEGQDEKAARELAARMMKEQPKGTLSYKVVPPPPVAEAKEPAQRTWVLLQVRASPEVFVDLINRLAVLAPGGG
jgi:hypothetical protein